MPVTDTDITDWLEDFRVLDTNTPRDDANIATLLGDEVRNIKSVVREQAERKAWVDQGWVVEEITLPFGVNNIILTGEHSEYLPTGQLLKIESASLGTTYHYVFQSSDMNGKTNILTSPVYEFVGRQPAESPNLTVVNPARSQAAGDITADYPVNAIILMINPDDGSVFVRKIEESEFSSGTTRLRFDLQDDTRLDDLLTGGVYDLYKLGPTLPTTADKPGDVTRFEHLAFNTDSRVSGELYAQQGRQMTRTADGIIGNIIVEPDDDYVVKLTPVDMGIGDAGHLEGLLFVPSQTEENFNFAFNVDPLPSPPGSGQSAKIDILYFRNKNL